MFGKVYLISNVLPPVCIGSRMFSRFVVKVAKTDTKGAAEDLISEVEALANLSHVNIVQILGFVHGPSPQDERPAYMMCLEYAESDLQKLLHHKDDAVHGDYSQALMVTLAVEIARGLAYIHSMDKMHLDLKPENVLLARDGDEWTAKVADFGAQVINMAGAPAQPGAAVDGSVVRGEPVAGAGEVDGRVVDRHSDLASLA